MNLILEDVWPGMLNVASGRPQKALCWMPGDRMVTHGEGTTHLGLERGFGAACSFLLQAFPSNCALLLE